MTTFENDATPIQSLAFSPDGKQVASTHHDINQLWDVATKEYVFPPLKHHGRWRSSTFSAGSSI
jgi:WD40 repeat protein